MTISTKPVSMGTWVCADSGAAIHYTVCPRSEAVEFTFDGLRHFYLTLEEGALEHCIAIFAEALTNYRTTMAGFADDDQAT